MEFPWYKVINRSKELQQGDFIPECPIIIPPSKLKQGDEPEVEVKLIDSVILSQSCDLVNDKIEIVLICPYYPLKTFLDNVSDAPSTRKQHNKIIENLKKGYLPGFHLLNKDIENGFFRDYQVVDFKNVYGISYPSMKQTALELYQRIRLLPPYREHLSQAFARYFMRVGLPQDIEIEGY